MCTNKREHALPWIVILGVETLIIILGNIATVIVFWKNRSQLKQTCLFLINLTVADLMVGIGNIESVVVEIHISFMTSSSCKTTWGDYVVSEEFFGCASIGFLALISLERLYAVVWPFRIRTTSTRKYIFSVGVVWLLSGTLAVAQLLGTAATLITQDIFMWFVTVYLLLCLIIILCAYPAIWFFSKKEDPRLPLNRLKRNKELAKTLFIVTLLSLITWLPFTVVHNLRFTLKGSVVIGPVLVDVTQFLQLANSFINPVVYCFRMPLFRRTLREMLSRKKTTRLHVREHQTCPKANIVILLSISNLNVAS